MNSTNEYAKLGALLKNLREKLNVTRKDLAEGICSPSYITKIESGERCTNPIILYKITNKLKIPFPFLLELIKSPNVLTLKPLIKECILNMHRYNYRKVEGLIEQIEKNFEINSLYDKQNLSSIKYFLQDYFNKDYMEGIKNLDNSLNLTYKNNSSILTDMEVTIISAKAFFMLLNEEYINAYNLLKELYSWYHLNKIIFINHFGQIALIFIRLSAACNSLGYYNESLKYIEEGIEYSKRYDLDSKLRDFYYLKGENYYLQDKKDMGINLIKKAFLLDELIALDENEFKNIYKDRLKRYNISF